MAWWLRGTYFENCPCDVVCPCTVSGLTLPADVERCDVLLVFHVEQGEIDGLNVGGLTVAVLADTPAVMSEGNWRVGLFLDEAGTPEQRDKLTAVFSGQLGGPMALLAPLIGEVMGSEVAPITYSDDGRRHRVTIGDTIDVEIEDIVPSHTPDGEVGRLTGMFHPANSTLTIAQATRARVGAFGLDLSNDGKNGHAAPFSWSA